MIIAAWSGPRNLSTAMMYAFGARPDFEVLDEPFYAAYLAETGLDHPMREDILAVGDLDPVRVAQVCGQSGDRHVYQKHMTHHMLPVVPRAWFDAAVHVMLIRHPARVLASYARKRENPTLDDIGFAQQAELFDDITARGLPCVVIDSYDIRSAPSEMMQALCAALSLRFDPQMLQWPKGGHISDGVWAAHWYDAVHRSTGFAGAEGPLPELPEPLHAVLAQAMPYYQKLHAKRLMPPKGVLSTE